MAFRQPTHHAPQRTYVSHDEFSLESPPVGTSQHLDESQEWILFSTVPPSATERTHTTSTERTRQTVGRSRLSDYGSLDTAARSYEFDEDESEHTEDAIVEDEDDGELDSLDSHLHEFGADSGYRETARNAQASTNPVLPTHDGLGSFRLNRTAMGDGVQEHLYEFERYNPRRIKRRKESLDIGQLELEGELTADAERTQRIEEWRLEQSKALLEEIQRETRRRKQSSSSVRVGTMRNYQEEELATFGSAESATEPSRQESAQPKSAQTESKDPESFWTRITRRVIQDLMGIDDRLLSILFGEALPENLEAELPATNSSGEIAMDLIANRESDSWENRLLERIAQELGLLVNQVSDHPGAFSTYLDVQQATLPYAGLPVIPEATAAAKDSVTTAAVSSSMPVFHPTIPASNPHGDLLYSLASTLEGQTESLPRSKPSDVEMRDAHDAERAFTKEEWEKQLDIRLVFSYLRSRFTSRKAHTAPYKPKATSQQDAAARVARVRQHHPLVTRPQPTERRPSYRVVIPAKATQQRGRSSSCASQSTKKSARRQSGSSRHYWDINGSIGSGSIVVSTGGMGAWGEV